eukprot:gnl/Chilomastix_caulleri/5834.p1 GENE.gnl/Chilomastix_caulleri/5834~~gnl/Chilomastix_caulleri/5834.p1  ORF type:complete len:50 (+),score=8.86 gnl/Chilomastix_caulleri/5834:311-460(+)
MSAVNGFISRLTPAYPIATDEKNTVARPVMEALGVVESLMLLSTRLMVH